MNRNVFLNIDLTNVIKEEIAFYSSSHLPPTCQFSNTWKNTLTYSICQFYFDSRSSDVHTTDVTITFFNFSVCLSPNNCNCNIHFVMYPIIFGLIYVGNSQ